MVKRVNAGKLPGGNELAYQVRDPGDSSDEDSGTVDGVRVRPRTAMTIKTKKSKKKKSKKKIVSEVRDITPGIDVNMVFDLEDKEDKDFMDSLNSKPHIPSDVLDLQPGVQLNQNGDKVKEGPEMDRRGRMTLEEYYHVAADQNQVRYEKSSTHSQRSK